ncbi:MAG: hypothetical protein ACI9YP_000157, partial [Colwellia sp.]
QRKIIMGGIIIYYHGWHSNFLSQRKIIMGGIIIYR